MLSKDTGSRQTDGGDACVTCHVYQSGTRTMEYILCSGPWPCSATTPATHFLRVSVILRSGCWVLRKWMNNIFMGWQHRKTKTWALMLWGTYQGETSFNWILLPTKLNFSKNFFSPFRKVISLWDLKITFILIKCISCTGNQFTLSPTNKKRDQQKDRPS